MLLCDRSQNWYLPQCYILVSTTVLYICTYHSVIYLYLPQCYILVLTTGLYICTYHRVIYLYLPQCYILVSTTGLYIGTYHRVIHLHLPQCYILVLHEQVRLYCLQLGCLVNPSLNELLVGAQCMLKQNFGYYQLD